MSTPAQQPDPPRTAEDEDDEVLEGEGASTTDAGGSPDDDPQEGDGDGDGASGAAGSLEPAPGPEGEALASQKQLEAMHKKLDAESARHENRLREIMGDDFDLLIVSPLDFVPGYLWRPDVAPIPPEVAAATYALLGVAPEPEYPEDEEAEVCERCRGFGKLTTGSRVPNQETRVCPQCSGAGWRQKVAAVVAPNVAALPVALAGAGAPPPPPSGVTDQWGRPGTHPHFGIPPAMVGAVTP